jgi:hypothetical protein
MSSQSNSKCCDAITLKGRNCRNYAIKGEKWCYQHKKKLSSKLIVHTAPVVEFSPVSFSNYRPSQNVCCFRNKFGEHVCTENVSKQKWCEFHQINIYKFKATIHKLTKLAAKYKSEHRTLDTFVKLLDNITNFILKYKEYIVNYSLDAFVQNFCIILTNNINTYSGDFWVVTSPLVVLNEFGLGVYIQKLITIRSKLVNLNSNRMIRQVRHEKISNNIKINKLSEICLKKSETSNEIIPVFSKGIDKHILSFIV